jgi:hypothetical protein
MSVPVMHIPFVKKEKWERKEEVKKEQFETEKGVEKG